MQKKWVEPLSFGLLRALSFDYIFLDVLDNYQL